jgi:hypothetical protein
MSIIQVGNGVQRSFQKHHPDTLFRLRDHPRWALAGCTALTRPRHHALGSLAFDCSCAIVAYEIALGTFTIGFAGARHSLNMSQRDAIAFSR